MNEAKEFESIDVYQMREDKKYKQKIEDTLKLVNVTLIQIRLKSDDSLMKECVKNNANSIIKRNKEKRVVERHCKTLIEAYTQCKKIG